MQYRFSFDHAVSDGQGGYGVVVVDESNGVDPVRRFYIGRGFAPTVLVERFPDAGLTYPGAAALVKHLSRQPTNTIAVWSESATYRREYCTRPFPKVAHGATMQLV